MTEAHTQQPPVPDQSRSGQPLPSRDLTARSAASHIGSPNTSKWDDSELQPQARPRWWQQHRTELIGLAVLLLILAAVVFWLPDAVKPSPATDPAAPPAPSAVSDTANGNQTENTSAGNTAAVEPAPGSPWQDAQLAKARREAQDILAKLLDLQKSLEAMQVNLWAKDAFATAAGHASHGDELYRNRDFPAALSSYQTALAQFEALTAQAEVEFNQALAAGRQAILDQQPQDAINAYTLATAIHPNSDEAQQGLARAQVQEEVIEQLDAADAQIRQQQYQQARGHLEQALKLDSESELAKARLVEVQQAIRDDNFASVMGLGYNLLQQQQYAQAIAQFRQALNLKPGDVSAQEGITQATHLQTQGRMQQALQQAAQLEEQEQWQQALTSYQTVQQLDASVVAARVGALRSQARAQLDQQLQQLIDQPLRLSDSEVYRSAQQLLADAAQVKPRGPRIERQQQQLQQALAQAQQPIAVLLRSDNKTSVTLYRVGSLGSFKEHSLELKPGHYTLVGSRDGYRDVRTEFTLQPGGGGQTIVIQCEEKIALGG